MPLWRCPHCATPQPETSRCWLCGRLTTTCGACRHYRRGVAGGLGLCGRNPRRLALRGTEVLPCWEAMPALTETHPSTAARGTAARRRDDAGGRAPRTFVPVDDVRTTGAEDGPVATAAPEAVASSPLRWSLWGDPEA